MSHRAQLFLIRLISRNRATRFLFVAAILPPVYIADLIRRCDPPRLRWAVEWVKTGEGATGPTIPVSDTPAVVRRRHRKETRP